VNVVDVRRRTRIC